MTSPPWIHSGPRSRAHLWLPAALIAILILNFFFTPDFMRIESREGHLYGNLVDCLDRAAPLAIVALGMALVIATGGVDLSVGSVAAIAAAFAAGLVARPSYSILAHAPDWASSTAVAITAALVVAAAIGWFNGILVAVFGVQPIVATLVLMVAGRGAAQLLTSGQIVTFNDPGLASLGGGFFLGFPRPIWIAAGMFLAIRLAVRFTALDLFIQATGDNPCAARVAAVPVSCIRQLVYAFSGLCAGAAGLMAASDIRAADANNAGRYLELDAILAVVLGGASLAGGRFRLGSSILGAVLIQLVTTTMLARGVAAEFMLIVKAGVIFTICALHSPAIRAGLDSRRHRRRRRLSNAAPSAHRSAAP